MERGLRLWWLFPARRCWSLGPLAGRNAPTELINASDEDYTIASSAHRCAVLPRRNFTQVTFENACFPSPALFRQHNPTPKHPAQIAVTMEHDATINGDSGDTVVMQNPITGGIDLPAMRAAHKFATVKELVIMTGDHVSQANSSSRQTTLNSSNLSPCVCSCPIETSEAFASSTGTSTPCSRRGCTATSA